MGGTPTGRHPRAGPRTDPRRHAGRRSRAARRRHGRGEPPAVRRLGHPDQGPGPARRGPGYRARRSPRPAVELRPHRAAEPRSGACGRGPEHDRTPWARRAGTAHRPEDGRAARGRLCRGRPAGAAVPGRGLRHGGDRSTGPWHPGARGGRRWRAAEPRPRLRRSGTGHPGASGRRRGARRCPAPLAWRLRVEGLAAWFGTAAARHARRLGGDVTMPGRSAGTAEWDARLSVPGSPVCAPDWLALREAADASARSPELVEEARAHLAAAARPGVPTLIRDLGCGSGSMGRWLAGRLPGPQHWILCDRDPGLLARARAGMPSLAADGAAVTARTWQDDLTSLRAEELAGTSLVTASAVLDLLTLEEVDGLAAACVQAGCAALLTLTVIGRVQIDPHDPLDEEFAAAF